MTVHLISVGRSVLETLGDPGKRLGGDSALRHAIADAKPHELLADEGIGRLHSDRERASEWVAAAFAAADSAPGVRLRELAARVRPRTWPRQTSAELDTFGRVRSGAIAVPKRDIAVLICSDTPDGLLAGTWNAVALAGGGFARVRYLPDSSAALASDDLRGRILLVRVTGLDAGHEGFRDAMRGLGYLARNLFSSHALTRDEEFEFYLSGGFKAAVPYLIGLAEAVRSVDDECLRQLGAEALTPVSVPYPVKAWVQHETAPADAKAIEIPLRRLLASAVREELSGYDASGRRDGRPGSTQLNGYAYEIKKQKRGKECSQLTPFGEGLRALLGVRGEGTGDR